jgi:peptidoglycan/LPS O-acetylase OafA/YrhL
VADSTTESVTRPRVLAEVPALDGLRAVCVAAVALSLLLPLAVASGITGVPVIGPLVSATWLGYDALFVLSGLLLARTRPHFIGPQDLLRWWGRRLVRIYPVYAIATLGLLGLGLTSLTASADMWSILRSVALIAAVEPSFAAPMWGVSVLWLAILLAPLVIIGLDAVRSLPGILAGIGVVLLAVVMVVTTTSSAGPTWGFGAYVRGVGEVLLGATAWVLIDVGMARASRGRRARLGNALALVGTAIGVVALAAGLSPGWALPAVIAVVVGAALGDRNVVMLFDRLAGPGAAAYAAFGAAAVVCTAAVGLARTWDNAAALIAACILALGLAAALGAVLWRLVERPTRDRLDSPLLRG